MPKMTKADKEIERLKARLATVESDLHQALEQNKELYADREAWRHRAMSAYDALADTRQLLERERAQYAATHKRA